MTMGLSTSGSLLIRKVSSYSGPVDEGGQPVPQKPSNGPQGPPRISLCSTKRPTRGSSASNCSLDMRTSSSPILSS